MTSDVQITTGRAPGPHVVISTGGPLRTSVGAVKKGSADDRALARHRLGSAANELKPRPMGSRG